MAVGFKVKFYWYQIGHGNFLHSFFSTVAYNLENGNWGSDISKDITDLSNYFVTSDGNDFLTVFSHALEKAKEVNAEIVIKSM